jgi:hypothetical protein
MILEIAVRLSPLWLYCRIGFYRFVTMNIGNMNDVFDVKDPNHERQQLAGNRLLLQLHDSSLFITPKGRK